MKYFIKKFRKDISESIGQFIAISLVVCIGIAFFVGLSFSYKIINDSIENFYDKTNLADSTLIFSNITEEEIDKIEEIEGIKLAEGRIVIGGTLLEDHNVTLQSYSNEYGGTKAPPVRTLAPPSAENSSICAETAPLLLNTRKTK